MNIDNLEMDIIGGSDITLTINNEKYSITSIYIDGLRLYSFCKYYEEPINFKTIEGLMNYCVNGKKLKDIILTLNENEVDYY